MLKLQVIPYSEIEHLSSVGRIRKLLNMAKENKIVLLEGRLKREEEAELIKATMEEINKDFRGIELAVLDPVKKKDDMFKKLKTNILNSLVGNRLGLTILGPASIVKDIKKDPSKIELLMKEGKKRR
jgi:hypothetical protein